MFFSFKCVCPRGIKVTLSDLWDFSPVSVFRSLLKYLQMHLHIIGYISKVFTWNGISNVSSKLCALEDLKSHYCGICEVFINVSFQMFHQIFSSQIFLTFSVFLFCSTKQIFCVPSKPDQIIGATFDSEPQNMLYCQILCVPSKAHLRGLASVPRHLEPFLPTVRESWSMGLHSDYRVMDTN